MLQWRENSLLAINLSYQLFGRIVLFVNTIFNIRFVMEILGVTAQLITENRSEKKKKNAPSISNKVYCSKVRH